MAHSQKEDAEKIIAAIEIALNQARTLGTSARQNSLEWNNNPFPWASAARQTWAGAVRQAWSEGYSEEEDREAKGAPTTS